MTRSDDTEPRSGVTSDRPERERLDDSLSYHDILQREIRNALQEIRRPTPAVFISGVSAGLNVSFGALFMGMVLSLSNGFSSPVVARLTLGSVSTIGFLFVILGQTELFTAHTTMAILPVLDGRASLRDLGELWAAVYVSNLLGCAGFVVLIAMLGPTLEIAGGAAFTTLATELVDPAGPAIFLSAVIAGWLMGLVTWLVAGCQDTTSRVLVIIIVTAGIGFAPFHHALLGTTEVLSAIALGPAVTLADFGHFLLWTTAGNVVGGAVFVALLNYGHVAYFTESEYSYYDENQ
ncbi:formate/nitrite transporter family protein [Halorientalis regularis]|jgi:formate/nitrite transporter FocA (FNT family)|uniref:Formate/nitrite transporter FocA, FNT family n=1 Tax=Halorientalis regularis TaxID=660518 RepID=A0A1G7QA34_9EURY|nr:formate/nitrite transporter family protein [Halorientalis regularis]SDF95447.1 Formate/nitrite transporter FocA, FNT family [Halorientalis regularis]